MSDINENHSPADDKNIEETYSVKKGLDGVLAPNKKPRKLPMTMVRFYIALALVLNVFLLSVGGVVMWILRPELDLKNLLVILTPVTTLAATSVTFYFSESKKKP